ncbi:MAG TPA: hypothetical protein VEB19_14980, partial [Gemmatimonadaceae bacterium]|nr:hypothetical protein [Gemmatimonadaceae bacterium]
MKIDIHAHTRKAKSGDARTRDISPGEFCERVLSTDVGIIAITNHNLFDLEQYEQIREGLKDAAQAWPGVELDILDGANRGHLLVIASPSKVEAFATAVFSLTGTVKPDVFAASVEQVIAAFEPLAPLYVAHYRQKKPNISDGAL